MLTAVFQRKEKKVLAQAEELLDTYISNKHVFLESHVSAIKSGLSRIKWTSTARKDHFNSLQEYGIYAYATCTSLHTAGA